jgi:UDP-2-acetamido-3-amino-2,3-dideoxy-glucuronate N-acetyltransferase
MIKPDQAPARPKKETMIHSTAQTDGATIGAGTRVWQYCVILPGAKVGEDCNICAHVFIESDVVIGSRVTIKCGVQLWNGLRVDDDVFIGPNVTFTNDARPRSGRNRGRYLPTTVHNGASVGANATILPGITIGHFAFIAAGAVITRTVPPYALVVGNPGKLYSWVCRCGTDLTFDSATGLAHCVCGNSFKLKGDVIEPL